MGKGRASSGDGPLLHEARRRAAYGYASEVMSEARGVWVCEAERWDEGDRCRGNTSPK